MNAEKAILLPSRTRRASGKREETSGGWAVGSENQRRVRAPTCLPGETWVTGAAADTRLARPGSVSQSPVLHRRVQSGKSAVRVQQPVSASHSHWMEQHLGLPPNRTAGSVYTVWASASAVRGSQNRPDLPHSSCQSTERFGMAGR